MSGIYKFTCEKRFSAVHKIEENPGPIVDANNTVMLKSTEGVDSMSLLPERLGQLGLEPFA